MNNPVPVPERPGKIVYKKKGEHTYVLLETGRRYDPERKYNLVERKVIGLQIPEYPELMLPNENYQIYFGEKDGQGMKEQKEMVRSYKEERDRSQMLRQFFEQVYFEFMVMSRKMPEAVVSPDKVKRINRILRPLKEMMEGEEYAEFLELLPERRTDTEDRAFPETKDGMTYGDAALALTVFKSAVNLYFQKRIMRME